MCLCVRRGVCVAFLCEGSSRLASLFSFAPPERSAAPFSSFDAPPSPPLLSLAAHPVPTRWQTPLEARCVS